MIEIMKIKTRIRTTLICILFGYGIAAAQNPKMEQVMNSKRKHIAEVAALTGKGDLDKLKPALIDGLNDGMTVGELKEVMVHAYAYCGFPVPCADYKPLLRYSMNGKQKVSRITGVVKHHR